MAALIHDVRDDTREVPLRERIDAVFGLPPEPVTELLVDHPRTRSLDPLDCRGYRQGRRNRNREVNVIVSAADCVNHDPVTLGRLPQSCVHARFPLGRDERLAIPGGPDEVIEQTPARHCVVPFAITDARPVGHGTKPANPSPFSGLRLVSPGVNPRARATVLDPYTT